MTTKAMQYLNNKKKTITTQTLTYVDINIDIGDA